MKTKQWYLIALVAIVIAIPVVYANLSDGSFSDEKQQKTLRKVERIVNSSKSKAGPLTMKQPLPSRGLESIDPFLLLHHHGPEQLPAGTAGLPFGPHPHRGFETVTFIYHGDVAHRDSKGYENIIADGGIQYMTAGKGIVHSERSSDTFKKNGGKLEMIQIWINLPARLKMIDAAYTGLTKEQIPVLSLDNNKTTIQVVSGEWNGKKGNISGAYPASLFTVAMESGSSIEKQIKQEENILLYVLDGEYTINGSMVKAHQLVLFGNEGNTIQITASKAGKLLLGHALPIKEPVVSYGPFVMNTMEEIQDALEDYATGKMGILIE